MAIAALKARGNAGDSKAEPLAVVWAPSISDRMEGILDTFVSQNAKGLSWGLIDDDGRFLLSTRLDRQRRPASRMRRTKRVASSGDLFSDLNQWLLKVLLAERLPTELANQSARGPFVHATRLAERANVSLPVVTRLLTLLAKDGFAEEGARPLALLRVPELLERWRNAVARSARREFSVRLANSTNNVTRWMLEQGDPDLRIAFGLFGAAEQMGLKYATGVPQILYLDHRRRDIDEEYLQVLGLLAVSAKEPSDFRIWVPRFPESVFRGGIRVREDDRDKLVHRYTDVIQTWSDLTHFPARGLETAELVWAELIEPHLSS